MFPACPPRAGGGSQPRTVRTRRGGSCPGEGGGRSGSASPERRGGIAPRPACVGTRPQVESPRGIAPRGALRTVLEPLSSHGSSYAAAPKIGPALFRSSRSSRRRLPRRSKLHRPPPSLQSHYGTFRTTTRWSAPVPRIGTLPLAGPPLAVLPSHRGDRFPRSIQEPGSRSCRLHAGCRPDSKQVPSGLVPR